MAKTSASRRPPPRANSAPSRKGSRTNAATARTSHDSASSSSSTARRGGASGRASRSSPANVEAEDHERMAMEIVKAIRRILRKTAEHSRELGRSFGLSAPQVLCLRAIAEHPHAVSAHGGLGGDAPRHGGQARPRQGVKSARSEWPRSAMTVARLAEAVQMPIATVSRILDRLEQGGLVERQRAVEDRRRVHVVLTESGRTKLAHIPTPLHEQFLIKLRQLDQSAQEELLAGLRRVVDMMDAGDLDVAPIITSEVDVTGQLPPREAIP
jgi:DNA-binding MarR family transcriptional regulator